ncbi:hypothetical protein SPRG_13988 [Saprolegnia parasitica CBS 223.65]|uniref:Helicase ATP-binding domain-containing protein n=1 Tax=Saprolegnia parasitica (strain CBS 223.65) TaxID=695850 RepID=A0A067BUE5_SAPPC|nr:hypothetical protein SPRG_13988 [Saprolegnia parasitica CBS 223.65]KDO20470.1 hypothetical protein SPRG_13988 [Saprolegnia parasitica CBS 223.65]|eukprot:XP_012208797.1 hypothetical protein SPRG_13988 [Saprolegnia parasitica CBS 223.65]
MGIRGLTSYCHANQADCGDADVDLSGQTLAVDLDSFLHYACEQVSKQFAPFDASWVLLGGDQRALYVWVQDWMKKFFRAKIRLKFVRDPPGCLNTIKDVTHEKRADERAEKSAIVRDGIFASPTEVLESSAVVDPTTIRVDESSAAAKIAVETHAVFPLARATVVRCIQHAGCSLITTSVEADEALGKMVRDGLAFAVLSQDSDYLLMQNVSYIPFPNVTFGDDETVTAFVYRATKVADCLGVAPTKLIEVALACGNDFTPYLERHFDFATLVNLPSLRRVNGFLGVQASVEWLASQFGETNWLDDPSFQLFLKGNASALSYVYAVYSFYGAEDQLLSRYPAATRLSCLPPAEWKKAIKLLDKQMYPNFALDVLYCQERYLSARLDALESHPIAMDANCLIYHTLGQTQPVIEFLANGSSRSVTPLSSDGKAPIPIHRLLATGKETRATAFQRNVVFLLEKHPALQARLQAWKGAKTHFELQVVANAISLLVPTLSERLHTYVLPLLLTAAVCKTMQKHATIVPLVGVANAAEMEASVVYRYWIDWQLHHLKILGLSPRLNEHAFFSAGVFSTILSLVTPQVYSKNHVNAVARHFFGDDVTSLQLCSWSYWMLAPLFEEYQPPPLPLLAPKGALLPSVLAKRLRRPKTTTTSAPPSTASLTTQLEQMQLNPPPLPMPPREPLPPREPVHIEKLIFTLPVFAHKDELLNNVGKNPLTIIQGETGCGKSTSVPQFILDEDPTVNMYITQPRRVAAITLASTVAKMRGEEVGNTIGYRVGQFQRDSKATRITYATTGYMLERIIHSPESIAQVTHLVLDEAHERSMDMDLLLLMIKTNWHLWPNLKLIIMSATMDAAIFFKYFKDGLPSPLAWKKPLFVGSALYDVTAIYMDEVHKHISGVAEITALAKKLTTQLAGWKKSDLDPEIMGKKITQVVSMQLDLCVALALHITKTVVDPSCILIFLPGISDIQYVHEQLEKMRDIQLFVLHSELDIEDQEKAFAPVEGKVKIILSTNIAESSVTIPDQIMMPTTGHMEVLVRSWCSQASVKQRSGRAGRIRPGTAYHLFTKSFMNECMAAYTTPELLRKPLDKIVLQLKAQLAHIDTPTNLLKNAMSVPNLNNITGAYKVLHEMAAVTEANETTTNAITPFGVFCTNFPLDVRLCRLLMFGLSAYDLGMQHGLVDVIILASILASPDLHVAPSRFHITSAGKYMAEMKHALEMDESDDQPLWSEPLAMWRLVTRCLKLKSKGAVMHLLRKHAIATRRFQTMCVLMGDVCLRFVRLAKRQDFAHSRALQPSVLRSVMALEKFCNKGFCPDWKHEHTPVPMLRLVLLLNYTDSLVAGTLPQPGAKANKKGLPRTNQEPVHATLTLDEESKWVKGVPLDDLVRTLAPIARDAASEIHSLKVDQKSLTILFAKTTTTTNDDDDDDNVDVAPSFNGLPFGLSLLHFMRDRSFPIDVSTLPLWEPSSGSIDSIRLRMPPRQVAGCSLIAWKQLKSGIKVNCSGRNPMGLPFKYLNKDNQVHGIFSEQLLTGDGSMMLGGKCTLLPPAVDSYLAILMLLSAKRSVWFLMDKTGLLCVALKVDGHNYLLPEGVALPIRSVMATVNQIRKDLSHGLTKPLRSLNEPSSSLSGPEMDALFSTAKAKGKKWDWVQMELEAAYFEPFPQIMLDED